MLTWGNYPRRKAKQAGRLGGTGFLAIDRDQNKENCGTSCGTV